MPTMNARDWGCLLSEANGNRSRETVTIESGSGKLYSGQVLAKRDSNNKYVPAADTGSDGEATAVAVLGAAVDATDSDADGVIVARDAEIIRDTLIFDASVNDESKTKSKIADLKSVGIIVR